MSLLTVNHLSLSFHHEPVVRDVSFCMEKGEMLALVGESGSGKSLTALSCLGLQPPQARVSGDIIFAGEALHNAPEPFLRQWRGKRIGMVFQEPMTALNPLHTIGKQLAEPLVIHQPRMTRGARQARMHELLEQVGLPYLKQRLDAYPHQLSGGERQRLMIAMAIANGPDLLIADEPTTAVDVTIQVKILSLLKELQASLGMAILFITHDLTVVRRMAERVAVMSKGEIVEQGPVAQIFQAPSHPYTKLLLNSEPKGSPLPLAANAPELLGCEHVKVYFPIKKGVLRRTVDVVKAVDDISLHMPRGSTLGIVGESGSGKTTLGMALLRLVASEGRIVFAGQPIEGLNKEAMRPLRKHMQLVFQDPFGSLNPRMSVRQILEEGLLVHFPHLNAQERTLRVETILTEVNLPTESKDRYPHEFSGGQRQRISIARAMILQPDFVMLDEPTSALDLTIQAQIIDLLKRLQSSHGVSYLFISHDLRVVKALAHHIAVMRNGRIVETGDTERIFTSPQQEYTKSLIKAAFLEQN